MLIKLHGKNKTTTEKTKKEVYMYTHADQVEIFNLSFLSIKKNLFLLNFEHYGTLENTEKAYLSNLI